MGAGGGEIYNVTHTTVEKKVSSMIMKHRNCAVTSVH